MGDKHLDFGKTSRVLLASDLTDDDDDDDADDDDADEEAIEEAKLRGANLSRPWILSTLHTSSLSSALVRFTTLSSFFLAIIFLTMRLMATAFATARTTATTMRTMHFVPHGSSFPLPAVVEPTGFLMTRFPPMVPLGLTSTPAMTETFKRFASNTPDVVADGALDTERRLIVAE